jgi:hypothetical protein
MAVLDLIKEYAPIITPEPSSIPCSERASMITPRSSVTPFPNRHIEEFLNCTFEATKMALGRN